jgi:hypothetical protein
VVTPWREFEALPELLRGKQVLLVDARRAFDKRRYAHYEGIGL